MDCGLIGMIRIDVCIRNKESTDTHPQEVPTKQTRHIDPQATAESASLQRGYWYHCDWGPWLVGVNASAKPRGTCCHLGYHLGRFLEETARHTTVGGVDSKKYRKWQIGVRNDTKLGTIDCTESPLTPTENISGITATSAPLAFASRHRRSACSIADATLPTLERWCREGDEDFSF
jgi:hypothetical protein